MAKNLILDQILTDLTSIWIQKIFSCIFPLIVVRHCGKVSLDATSWENDDQSLRKWQKTKFQAQIRVPKFCFMDFTSTAS